MTIVNLRHILIFFNKPKTILKDLVPENHIDIHSHILPGIDDGAQTIEDSIFLITLSVALEAAKAKPARTPQTIALFIGVNKKVSI